MSDKRRKAASAAKIAKDKLACNKAKKTPSHPTKSHVVKACKGGKEKIIRFGQQGVKGAGKNPKTAKEKARRSLTTPDIMHKTQNQIYSQLDIGLIR